MKGRLWSVVLAAGAGKRLSNRTGGIPKQFWRPHGGRSLLEETLGRLTPICPAERTVIVVGDQHRKHVRSWPAYPRSGRVVFQPTGRGTAAGVLVGLLPVLAADPDGDGGAVTAELCVQQAIGRLLVFAEGLHRLHHGAVGELRQKLEMRIVAIEQRDAVALQSLEDFGLGLRDLLEVAEMAEARARA